MALKIKARLRGQRQLQRALAKRGRDAPRALASALFLEGERIMAKSKPLVPVDEGPLRASGHVQLPRVTRRKVTVVLGYGGPAAQHAVVVHEGRRPGSKMPPPNALEGWASRHGIPTDPGTLFVLARSIGAKGTAPTKFLEKPFNEAIPGMNGRLARRVRRDFR